MSKDKFLRSNVHSDLLSKVIFRVDIAGITNLKGYINRVKGLESIRNAFGRVLPIRSRSINFVIDAQHAEYNKFTQEPEIDEGFRFLDCSLEPKSKAILDIVHDSIIISIDCSGAYSGSRQYTQLIVTLLKELFCYDSFVSIRRLGIRKIDKKKFCSAEEIFSVFERKLNLFSQMLDDNTVKTRKNYDLLEIDGIRYNFVQQFNRYIDCKDVSVLIDLDAFVSDEFFDMKSFREGNVLEELLDKKIQNQMFDFFKKCVTEKYLEDCYEV